MFSSELAMPSMRSPCNESLDILGHPSKMPMCERLLLAADIGPTGVE
jgi:hypothetical protein